jgi:acyl-CoA synthetase (AMP-forming)/AMP-acid ligase II
MIITSGKNVYPHEVELALASIPGVETAVAAGMPDDMRGSRIVAGIVPSCGGLTATWLSSGLDEVMTRDRKPLRYYLLDELPLTDRGKISRRMFLDWIGNGDPRIRPLP